MERLRRDAADQLKFIIYFKIILMKNSIYDSTSIFEINNNLNNI